jgi:hypothetical protein
MSSHDLTDLTGDDNDISGIPGPGLYNQSLFTLDGMAPSERIQRITNHLSNNYTRGLLNGDVAIITGKPPPLPGAPLFVR